MSPRDELYGQCVGCLNAIPRCTCNAEQKAVVQSFETLADCQPKPSKHCSKCNRTVTEGCNYCACPFPLPSSKPSEGAVSEYCRWPECECSSGAAERCSKPIYSDDARVAKIRDEDGRPRVVAICNELIAARASITTKHLQILDLGLRIRSLEAELEGARKDAARWQFMYDNDMTKEYRDHVWLLLNAAGQPHGSLFKSVVDAAMAEAKS